MTFLDHLKLFRTAIPGLDWFALAWFAACWIGYTLYADRKGRVSPSLVRGTDRMRMAWMERLRRCFGLGVVAILYRREFVSEAALLCEDEGGEREKE